MALYKRLNHMHAHYTDVSTKDNMLHRQEFFSYNTKIARLTTETRDYGKLYTLQVGYYFDCSRSTATQFSKWLRDFAGDIVSYSTIKEESEKALKREHGSTVTFYLNNLTVVIELKPNAIENLFFGKNEYREELRDYGRY